MNMGPTGIDGLLNFRDLGGLPLVSGGTTRPGVLWRSGALGDVTDAGREQLASSPIDVVVDLRTDAERQMAPDRLPTTRPIRSVELALLGGALADLARAVADARGSAGSTGDQTGQRLSAAVEALPSLAQMYLSMLSENAAVFVEVAKVVAGTRGDGAGDVTITGDSPAGVLIHCTAGKDRTGLAIALLLDTVGVRREAIVADYASSAANLAGEWADGMLAMVAMTGVPVTAKLVEIIAGSPGSAIEGALTWVDSTYGGTAEYLRSQGLEAAELEAMVRRLTA